MGVAQSVPTSRNSDSHVPSQGPPVHVHLSAPFSHLPNFFPHQAWRTWWIFHQLQLRGFSSPTSTHILCSKASTYNCQAASICCSSTNLFPTKNLCCTSTNLFPAKTLSQASTLFSSQTSFLSSPTKILSCSPWAKASLWR